MVSAWKLKGTHHEAVVDSDDEGVGEGDCRELEVTEVAGGDEGLRDDVHAVGGDAAENGRLHDSPQLLRLCPRLLANLLPPAATSTLPHVAVEPVAESPYRR
jgi:hypothetical protein